MKNLISLIILFVIISVTSGCASIMCSDHKTINISSEPSEAKFTIKDRYGKDVVQGVSPTNVTLKRGSGYFQAGDYTIEFEKAGYQKHTQPIKQDYETGWYFGGNIIVFGGLIGLLVVDPLTGAMWNIKDVDVTLQPLSEIQESKQAIIVPANEEDKEKLSKSPPQTTSPPNTESSQKSNLPSTEPTRKLKGYQATTDPKTGKIVMWPVYEDEKK
jgi:hypothetical protein